MASDRRRFFQALTVATAALLPVPQFLAAQNAAQRAPGPDEPPPDPIPAAKAAKAALENNQKDIRKDVQRLFQLASDLKKEVEKTDSTVILSVNMLRKAEEIEKLARQIKNRAKG